MGEIMEGIARLLHIADSRTANRKAGRQNSSSVTTAAVTLFLIFRGYLLIFRGQGFYCLGERFVPLGESFESFVDGHLLFAQIAAKSAFQPFNSLLVNRQCAGGERCLP
jgi:hypothetical protein